MVPFALSCLTSIDVPDPKKPPNVFRILSCAKISIFFKGLMCVLRSNKLYPFEEFLVEMVSF